MTVPAEVNEEGDLVSCYPIQGLYQCIFHTENSKDCNMTQQVVDIQVVDCRLMAGLSSDPILQP